MSLGGGGMLLKEEEKKVTKILNDGLGKGAE
jgi:hypothetical protein